MLLAVYKQRRDYLGAFCDVVGIAVYIVQVVLVVMGSLQGALHVWQLILRLQMLRTNIVHRNAKAPGGAN